MSKNPSVYCDSCGSPRGLESIIIKKEDTCEICGSFKKCNVIKKEKETTKKYVEAAKELVEEAHNDYKEDVKKEKAKTEKKPVVKKSAVKKETVKKEKAKKPATKKTSKKK